MQRAPKLRLIALAGTAALAIAVPLAAATAGPAETAHTPTPGKRPTGKAGSSGPATADGQPGAASGTDARDPAPLVDLGLPLLSAEGRTARCGPELASPQRIEAQTCVLAEQGRTWARTYYRNPTGDPLRAVLTLLRPDGTTVQAHCALPAADAPGVCETPAGPTAHLDGVPYGAVAEVSDVVGERLLLRSGGNSA
ncbi:MULTISPECIES: hypothetical protein [unclassified Streptomyces]|uniref:hypothetical protein n=1 Tax=unclassified Streptomyces TaxID=2593676 RepID=UPI0038141074